MSSDNPSTVSGGAHAGLPLLTEDNFDDWDMQIFAHLTGSHDHARVIWPTIQNGKPLRPQKPSPADPSASTDEKTKADEAIASWDKSERIVLGCFMATAGRLHRETILKHRQTGSSMYDLYVRIRDHHQKCDAFQRCKAWFQFFGIRRVATEQYMSYFRRVVAAYDKIDRITPPDQSPEDRAQEIKVFAILYGLPHDDPVRVLLMAQGGFTLANVTAATRRFDTGKKLADAKTERAHAARRGACWTCNERDHISRDCPHRVQQLITKRENARGHSGGRFNNNKGKGKGTAAERTGVATLL